MVATAQRVEVRPFTKDFDYPYIVEWWNAREMKPLPKDMLPNVGYMAVEEDVRVAAGFLYQSDATLTWLTWLVTSPEVSPRTAHEGLGLVIEILAGTAKALGYKALFTSLGHSGLIKTLKRHGFKTTIEGYTELVRRI